MIASLRHLRIALAIAETQSITRAAAQCHLTQPAVTLALTGLEQRSGVALFDRHPAALTPTPAGEALLLRLRRALALLDPALGELSPQLPRHITFAQLRVLVAVAESESFAAAARTLGLAQPTVHRAITEIEAQAGQKLFHRIARGVTPLRAVRPVAMAARLALSELDQAPADVAEVSGRDIGRVVIGAMPLSRSVLLGPAITLFRNRGRVTAVRVIEGPYAELVLGLRRGAIDFLVGALRPSVDDLVQEHLFTDEMAVVAHPGHPATQAAPSVVALAGLPWVVAPEGTPARDHFAAMFQAAGVTPPTNLVETGSFELLCDLVAQSDYLGFLSARQAHRAVGAGLLTRLPVTLPDTTRPIGLTFRRDWHPSKAQSDMLAAIRAVAAQAEAR